MSDRFEVRPADLVAHAGRAEVTDRLKGAL
jgi:hypothetical protein